ncbi:MAG: hypothetical protein AVDCRST_MAG89-1859, partial [uncultured Gemmatimonadetes bacterium]
EPVPLLRRCGFFRRQGAALHAVDGRGRGARRQAVHRLALSAALSRGPGLVRGGGMAQARRRGGGRRHPVGRGLSLRAAGGGGERHRRAARAVVARRGVVGGGPAAGGDPRGASRLSQGSARHGHQRGDGAAGPAPVPADPGGHPRAVGAARRGRGVHPARGAAGGRGDGGDRGVSRRRGEGPGDQGIEGAVPPRRGTGAAGGVPPLLFVRPPVAGSHRLHAGGCARRVPGVRGGLAVPRRPGPAVPPGPRAAPDHRDGGLDLSPARRAGM